MDAQPGPDFFLRLIILLVAFGPTLPIGAVMSSIGRRTMSAALIVAAFGGGIVSAPLSFLGSVLSHLVAYPDSDLVKAAGEAFLSAAIPEELAKFVVLVFFVLNHQDAKGPRDAILAGGFVGLGFATIENFLYVTGTHEWLVTGAVRAAISVPGHVSWGLIMGYFIVRHARGEGSLLPALAVPVLLHGLFDAVLMYRSKIETDLLPSAPGLVILFALVLLCAWGLIRWPICAELTRLDLEEDAETRMSDDAANQLVVVAGLSSLVLITAIPLAIIGAGAAAVAVDLRYASLIVLAIMPLTFVELWRRA